MELIDKVREILNDIGLENTIVDINYDEQKNIIGFLTSSTFNNKSDYEAQSIIWKALKNNLSTDELLRILGIFNETYDERSQRVSINKIIQNKPFANKLWLHKAPDNAKYWLLVDVAKLGDKYKSFFLIICSHENLKKGLSFVYSQDVIDFMELENGEIYEELFNKAYENAISEIKAILMKKHDVLTEKGLWGKNNRYNYVYENFQIFPHPITKTLFSKEEIELFEKSLQSIDDFKAKKMIEKQISISTQILSNQEKI